MELCQDVTQALNDMFTMGKGDKYTRLKEFGRFMPEVSKNPEKYILPQPELVPLLRKLKEEEGKFLFLATNSYYEYADLIMKHTLGP